MNSLAMNILRRSKPVLLSLALIVTVVFSPAHTSHAQQLRQGVRVEMAATNNAMPMPEADDDDAWIVAVTADGSLFFGINPVTPDGLRQSMKNHPRDRQQKLYIKADARAPFASVDQVIKAARNDLFQTSVLLTSQPESPATGTIAPPEGIEILVNSPSNADSIVVEWLDSSQRSPILKINNAEVPSAALQSTLRQLLQNRSQKVVVVKAAGSLPFGQVVHVVDVCRSIGAVAALGSPD